MRYLTQWKFWKSFQKIWDKIAIYNRALTDHAPCARIIGYFRCNRLPLLWRNWGSRCFREPHSNCKGYNFTVQMRVLVMSCRAPWATPWDWAVLHVPPSLSCLFLLVIIPLKQAKSKNCKSKCLVVWKVVKQRRGDTSCHGNLSCQIRKASKIVVYSESRNILHWTS